MAKKKMTKKFLSTPATLEGVALRKDGSCTLRFSTQEILSEDLMTIKLFYGSFGSLMFGPNELQPKDIPQQDPAFDGKSPSQRLRAIIFVVYQYLKERGKTSMRFEEFYSGQIEKIIDQYKIMLPPRD